MSQPESKMILCYSTFTCIDISNGPCACHRPQSPAPRFKRTCYLKQPVPLGACQTNWNSSMARMVAEIRHKSPVRYGSPDRQSSPTSCRCVNELRAVIMTDVVSRVIHLINIQQPICVSDLLLLNSNIMCI